MSFIMKHKKLVCFLTTMACIVIVISSLAISGVFTPQPQNIFEEIYQEVKATYKIENILSKIDDFDIKKSWPQSSWLDPMPEEFNIENEPSGEYKPETLPDGYTWTSIGFNFENDVQSWSISAGKPLNSNVNLLIWTSYKHNENQLSKRVVVFKEKTSNKSSERIDDEDEVKAYLQEYGITAADLDSYYDEIINKKVLTDWCSIFDSKFSPDNYGDITIETQWENW